MRHSRKINNKINKLHGRALRLAYNDKSSSFRELLERDKSVTIHERNIQVLLTEIFKKRGCTRNNDRNFQIQKTFIWFEKE